MIGLLTTAAYAGSCQSPDGGKGNDAGHTTSIPTTEATGPTTPTVSTSSASTTKVAPDTNDERLKINPVKAGTEEECQEVCYNDDGQCDYYIYVQDSQGIAGDLSGDCYRIDKAAQDPPRILRFDTWVMDFQEEGHKVTTFPIWPSKAATQNNNGCMEETIIACPYVAFDCLTKTEFDSETTRGPDDIESDHFQDRKKCDDLAGTFQSKYFMYKEPVNPPDCRMVGESNTKGPDSDLLETGPFGLWDRCTVVMGPQPSQFGADSKEDLCHIKKAKKNPDDAENDADWMDWDNNQYGCNYIFSNFEKADAPSSPPSEVLQHLIGSFKLSPNRE